MRQSVKILFSCEDFPRIALLPGSIVLVLEKLSNRFGCAYAALCLCGESPFAVWSSGFGVRSSGTGQQSSSRSGSSPKSGMALNRLSR